MEIEITDKICGVVRVEEVQIDFRTLKQAKALIDLGLHVML